MIKQEIESLKQSEVILDENGNKYEIVSTEKQYASNFFQILLGIRTVFKFSSTSSL